MTLSSSTDVYTFTNPLTEPVVEHHLTEPVVGHHLSGPVVEHHLTEPVVEHHLSGPVFGTSPVHPSVSSTQLFFHRSSLEICYPVGFTACQVVEIYHLMSIHLDIGQ